jgi:hypothetical protein
MKIMIMIIMNLTLMQMLGKQDSINKMAAMGMEMKAEMVKTFLKLLLKTSWMKFLNLIETSSLLLSE